jgi:hypothetical protein
MADFMTAKEWRKFVGEKGTDGLARGLETGISVFTNQLEDDYVTMEPMDRADHKEFILDLAKDLLKLLEKLNASEMDELTHK